VLIAVLYSVLTPQIMVTRFHKTQSEAGQIQSRINTIAEIALFLVNVFAGFLLDRFGRKWLYIFGFLVMAGYLTSLCYVGSIYPGILALTICSKVFGCSLLMNTPFTADYVQKQSMGPIVAIITALATTAEIVVTSGFIGL